MGSVTFVAPLPALASTAWVFSLASFLDVAPDELLGVLF